MATDRSVPEVPALLALGQPIVMPAHKGGIGFIIRLSREAEERRLAVFVFPIFTPLAGQGRLESNPIRISNQEQILDHESLRQAEWCDARYDEDRRLGE
jgi:hypothetical protein